jgi:hypothetical protein
MKTTILKTMLIGTLFLSFVACGGGGSGGGVDLDGDGYSIGSGDCDDSDASIHRGAVDICGDGIDQNCDGGDLLCVNEEPEEIVPLDENVRPFEKRRFVALSRLVEFVQIGSAYNGDDENNLFVIDPLEFNFNEDGTRSTSGGDDVMAAFDHKSLGKDFRKVAAKGMMDDDIQEEVAIVSWGPTGFGMLVILDPSGEPDATVFGRYNVDLPLAIDGHEGLAYEYDIATGDVDGDGYDEVLIAGSIPAENKGWLWIVDDNTQDNDLVFDKMCKGVFDDENDRFELDNLKIAAGNFDEDWGDEIVIALAAKTRLGEEWDSHAQVYYRLLDDASEDFIKFKSDKVQRRYPSEIIYYKEYFNVAAGDMDKDGRDEIAFVMHMGDEDFYYVEVIDDAVGEDGETGAAEDDTGDAHAVLRSEYGSIDPWEHHDARFFGMFDIDGDRALELFVGGQILDDLKPAPGKHPFKPISDYKGGKLDIDICFGSARDISFGDVNGDWMEDITILYWDSTIETIGFEKITDPENENQTKFVWRGGRGCYDYEETVLTIDERGLNETAAPNAIILSVNVDNDSLVVEYDADDPEAEPIEIEEAHTTYYSRNQIIAVLATPPAIAGLNSEDTTTSYSQFSSQGYSAGATVSWRSGILFGTDHSISAGLFASTEIGKIETELELSVEVTASASTSVESTRTITYTTGELRDSVIFSTTPYDRYQYTIRSHPDPKVVDTGLTVDIPQKPEILHWSKDYYNSHCGDQLPIGDEILQHTPGDISSYPDWDDVVDIMDKTGDPTPSTIPLIDDGMWMLLGLTRSLGVDGPTRVSETGSTSCEVELINAQDIEAGVELSIDVMAKACTVGICGGRTGGLSIGATFGATWTKGVTFESSVSAIPAVPDGYECYSGDCWAEHQYGWGMFQYVQTLKDIDNKTVHDFIVVNYWVE